MSSNLSIIELYHQTYQKLSPTSPVDIRALYSDQIQFEDPMKKLKGIDALESYFKELNSKMTDYRFEFTHHVMEQGTAVIFWKMHLVIKKLPNKKITSNGCSYIRFTDKIIYQKDYFDTAELLYENLPIIGHAIRFIKRQSHS